MRELYRHAFQREPGSGEVEHALAFIQSAEQEPLSPPPQPTPLDAWSALAQALLLSNEFVFVD